MDPHRRDELLQTFSRVAIERLMRRETVPVPGLGVLRVQHESSRLTEARGGERQLLPPHDRVVFEPDPSPK